LSILLCVLSVVSLIQHVGDVGLTSIFVEFISYYRQITYQVYGYIGQLFTIEFPPILMDAWTLSFVAAGAYVKTLNIEYSRLLRNFDTTNWPRYWKSLLFVFIGITFTGLAILLSSFHFQTYIDETQDLTRGALKNIMIVATAVAVFFVLNAYAPSV